MLAALWVTGHEGHVVPVSVGAAVIAVLVLARLAGLVRAVERAHAAERAARSRAEWSEQLLADQNERLRELDRVKDEFVTLVSHELRTPLTSIMGYLDLLEEETDGLSEEQRRFLAVVERNAERLARLVEDLLFVARLQAGGLELGSGEVELAAVAEKSVEAARPDAVLKRVELVLEAKSSKLTGDRLRLGQVLDNLVSNAVKFTPEGGRVTVRVSDGADGTLLEVADTGLGIPADEQERLFERFFRASTAATHAVPGTGLGLTVVKAIVEAHGGTIAVASEVGRGTTVRVNLPGVAGAAGTLAA
jgi:signal transduction histidine kinase